MKKTRNQDTDDKVNEWRLYLVHRECVRRNPKYKKSNLSIKRLGVSLDGKELRWFAHSWHLFVPGFLKLTNKEKRTLPREILMLPDPDEFPTLDKYKDIPVPESFDLKYLYEGILDEMDQYQAKRVLNGALRTDRFVNEDLAGKIVLIYFKESGMSPAERIIRIVDASNSKTDLKIKYEDFIDNIISERRKAGLKQRKASTKDRSDLWFDCLKAYDLREKQDLTYDEIGRIVWSDLKAADFPTRAKDSIKKARDLISNPPLGTMEMP
jgi:hypothetical protein